MLTIFTWCNYDIMAFCTRILFRWMLSEGDSCSMKGRLRRSGTGIMVDVIKVSSCVKPTKQFWWTDDTIFFKQFYYSVCNIGRDLEYPVVRHRHSFGIQYVDQISLPCFTVNKNTYVQWQQCFTIWAMAHGVTAFPCTFN